MTFLTKVEKGVYPLDGEKRKPGRPRKGEGQAIGLGRQEKIEQFVRIWQQARDCEEVSRRTGMHIVSCRVKATQLRKLGVRLKMMPYAPPVDIDKLNAIIDEVEETKVAKTFDDIK